jgi:hypothetical protein
VNTTTSTLLIIIATLLTGCLASLIGAIFSMHARFIRLEAGVRYIRKDVSRLQRDMARRMSGMRMVDEWTQAEREADDDKW